ncbi:vWA domain-containing protein [Mesorhizobium retamae]|uniref:VWA domain-containing protein n=1 Tax=Mesorhizobium retamae TaxID=2912854 RepID=A0ABS9QEG1_9HYPH|nr:VWA domain-containing protein [Mesorhizobium sp. IRAMC:0171]MCG7505804.1 VWA domain-containing protein [Mesorhizobium sp. IRAMC:0171]
MVDDNELKKLRDAALPGPDAKARARALAAAMTAFDEKDEVAPQGMAARPRLTSRALTLWREIMQKKLIATPAIAGLVALPIAGYTAFHLMQEQRSAVDAGGTVTETLADKPAPARPDADVQPLAAAPSAEDLEQKVAPTMSAAKSEAAAPAGNMQAVPRRELARMKSAEISQAAPRAESEAADALARSPANTTLMAEPPAVAPAPLPADSMQPPEENRDRIQDFKTNPVRSTKADPVSTFSIDVDTASYSFVRRSLKDGLLPQADTVRVEEMVNYFPYDWKGPNNAETPFNTTVSVMPAPWNAGHKLMHVAIKGYDMQPAVEPKANLVFLIDVSGSMDEPDKLPLLKSAFRLLVNKLKADDTISIVTYAGDAGTVLEPTKASEKDKILRAIDNLAPGGSTAGEAGIREAYRLAQKSFVRGGINRVMLATDGDFNVGQTDDDDLKRLIEKQRETGVFLSVLGFGRGNLNDQMMQTIAQNGNGTAAYIDTLAEAEKVLVGDASSTLFPIAKDVKIQVEFNPEKVSEYRLIGYETRALNREDFNNDRVDAGEIGSGHSVTAIYELTPKGAAQQVDDLRYGEATTSNGGVSNADEYAFVKIRYKLPDADTSKLITTPVIAANEVPSFDAAGTDQRFSIAVAAFGQKLRNEDATAKFGYDRIQEIANAARGADPFGYRAEFLSLVRLAAAMK